MNLSWVGKTYCLEMKKLEKVAEAAFSSFRPRAGEIEVCLVSRREIKRLNRIYRDKDAVTDVLSFLLEDKPLSGQIFICYTYVKEELSAGEDLSDQIGSLLIHGILHLYGYDHKNSEEERKMNQKAKKIKESVDG